MSATNETNIYKLPLFTDTDQPTWLGDFNGAMTKIDADMNAIGANASTALSAANNAVNRVGQVETTIAGVQATANNAYSLSTSIAQDVGTLNGQTAQLQSKFPITSDSLANGAVTAPKLDQTAIAAMWSGLTVRQFDSKDSRADNAGMAVPAGGELKGFYIQELGLLVLNKMGGVYTDAASALFTLPEYVPNNTVTGATTTCTFIFWSNSSNFSSWSSLYQVESTRQMRLASYPNVGDNFSLMASVVLYMGVNAGISANALDAYNQMNPTVG